MHARAVTRDPYCTDGILPTTPLTSLASSCLAPQVFSGLHAELRTKSLPVHAAGFALQAAATALRQRCTRLLATPLQAVLAPPASDADAALLLLSARREDRKVRLALCIAPDDQAGRQALACDAPAVHVFELQLPRKDKFAAEEGAEEEECTKSDTKSEQAAEGEGGAASPLPPAALEAATISRLHAALHAALLALDARVDFQKLRGVDAAVAGIGAGAERASTPHLQRALLLALADRNHIGAHSCIAELLNQPLPTAAAAPAAAPNEAEALPPLPELFWDGRWQSKRSRVSYAALSDDEESDEDEEEKLAKQEGKFVPFGSVVAASGRSIRVTVSTSAGLAAELPIWGLRMRADAEWAVRALRPERIVVLQEGERALVQADLLDADGKGVPSQERMLRAVLFATPALSPELQAAVALQRDGSLVPAQQGQAAPLLMPKREVVTGLRGGRNELRSVNWIWLPWQHAARRCGLESSSLRMETSVDS